MLVGRRGDWRSNGVKKAGRATLFYTNLKTTVGTSWLTYSFGRKCDVEFDGFSDIEFDGGRVRHLAGRRSQRHGLRPRPGRWPAGAQRDLVQEPRGVAGRHRVSAVGVVQIDFHLRVDGLPRVKTR